MATNRSRLTLRGPAGAARRCAGAYALAAALALPILLLAPSAVLAQQFTVSAAASLTNAFKELGAAFEADTPGATVRFNFAASGVLLQQIAQGAPVDVFASADPVTMDRAADRSLIEAGSRADFASNSVVLIEPLEGGVGLRSLQDLAGPAVRRIAVGKPATVPAGRYALAALDRAGLRPRLEAKLLQADNVRQVLDYVARGEVEAGFVYRTDAAVLVDKVRIVLTAGGHPPVLYPAAVVGDSRHKAVAARFVAFLATPHAREILARHGFGAP